MQFHGTPHWQFEKSPHHQRVTSASPCGDDGQFVWAYRALTGYRGCGWDPDALPETFERLYQSAVITHVKSVYYWDVDHWTFWKDYTFTFTIEWDKDCNTVTYFKAEGSLNGVVQEIVTCPTPSTTTKDYDDWITETSPDGTTGIDDLPPWPGSYPTGGSDTSEITSAGEDSVTYEYTAIDGTGTFYKLVTTIEMDDVLDTSTIRTIVSDMMATVPLTKGAPVPISGLNPADDSEISGTWGFPIKGATYNHAFVLYDVTDCCTKEQVIILNAIAVRDDHCQCSLHYTSPRQIWVYRDRRQTYMPAAFTISIPGLTGGGAGSLHSVGSYAGFIYGWAMRWADDGSGGFEIVDQRDTSSISSYECAAWGKKGLLSRTAEDEWTVLQDSAGDNTCLSLTPVSTCYRYYYPTDSDSAVESAGSTVFVFDEGSIYRQLPALTVEMDADCPFPEAGEVDCPEGDGSDVGITINPCL